MNKKGHKKRLKIRGLLVIILFIYLLGNIIYYFVRMPLKNIEITGNTYLKNNDITNIVKIFEYFFINFPFKYSFRYLHYVLSHYLLNIVF